MAVIVHLGNSLMAKQLTFASHAYRTKKRKTRRENFPEEMEAVVPRSALLAVVEPH